MTPEEKAREYHLMRTYGITGDQYNELLIEQQNSCAVCRRPQEDFTVRLAVDHDHATGEIRGLLCRYCNHRVVGRHRDAEILRRVADYVERHTGWFVPKKKPRKKRAPRKPRVRNKA